jgi:hypothetical protein
LPPAAIEALQRAGVTPTPSELSGAMVAQDLEAWSVTDLLTRLQAATLRGARLIGGGPAATS